jgi:hypothetical protein
VSSHWPALNVISGWMDIVGDAEFVMANDARGGELPDRLQLAAAMRSFQRLGCLPEQRFGEEGAWRTTPPG